MFGLDLSDDASKVRTGGLQTGVRHCGASMYESDEMHLRCGLLKAGHHLVVLTSRQIGGAEAASQPYPRCAQPGIRSCPLPVSYSGEVVQCCRSQLILAAAGATPSAARYKRLLQGF